MVLSTTQSNFLARSANNNKENIVAKHSRNDNVRRLRTRPLNTPSPSATAREAARDPRRRAQAPHTTPASSRSVRISVQDVDVDMNDLPTPSTSHGLQRSIQLPRHLGRPTFREISPAALEAVDPELKGVALEYIHRNLQLVGQQMLTVATSTTTDPPKDRLPRELEVFINHFSTSPPTHLFAVYGKTASRVAILPVHSLVLAAHCAHLPPLPPSPSGQSTSSTNPNPILPVVPLCLPHPASFLILVHYLYTKRADRLFASLLPAAPAPAVQGLAQLAQNFAATFTVQALLAHASRVHGLWSNLAALGVFDDNLSRCVETAWEVLVQALALSTGAQWQSEKVQTMV